MTIKKITNMAVFTAFGVLLMYMIAFPLPLFPEFLTYDPGDIPGMIAAFALGPWAGVMVQFMKCLIAFLIGGSKAGIVGVTANFVAGGTMVLAAGLIYQYRKTKLMAFLALIVGMLAASLMMAVADYYVFFPLWDFPSNIALIVGTVIPFNLAKFGISSVITFIVYKKVKKYVEKEKLKVAEVHGK